MSKVIEEDGTVYLISVFTADPPQIDAFCERQIEELCGFSGNIDGALGASLYRARDGKSVVKIAAFETLHKYYAWRDSDLFEQHLDRIVDIIGSGESGFFDLAFNSDWMAPTLNKRWKLVRVSGDELAQRKARNVTTA